MDRVTFKDRGELNDQKSFRYREAGIWTMVLEIFRQLLYQEGHGDVAPNIIQLDK